MAEFDDLFDDLEPRGTVRFTLSKVFVRSDKPLALVMRHAGDSNTEYKNLRVRLAKELGAQSGADADARLAFQIKIFAHAVIESWENCIGKDGKPLTYMPALGLEFLTAISKRAPEELLAAFGYAYDPNNFRSSTSAVVAELGK